ncbi:branched-chain amino acid ABC transporter substrate-binding protein [Pseudolysinimonas kribbensis]|uniref:Branched-chain amino acid ABC transporter substrate-binding protein n=2 Tax=Pseudolysinimonas kribbensis TaxID=433641 RepID=A0ABQ6K8U4_9MICO|nr:ABC transporter substrate-binding protein [Pseudolysinimonas kribbensis]GMA95719.1 branched-chain amino acid ABC transporter substrate-binding protein [Pseudolysinimonas kribbensis]
MAAAVKVAVTDINAAGGVNGKPVVLVSRDSGDASTRTAEASFADLVKNHADVVVGPVSSALAQRLLDPAQKAGVPLISPAAGYPQLADQPDFFRTVPAFGHEGTVLGSLLPGKGAKEVVLVATQEALGASIAAPLKAALAAHGGTLAASITVPLSGANAAAIAGQAKAAAPDAVVLATPDNGNLSRSLITALSSAGLGGTKLWLTGQNMADYSQALQGGMLAGVRGILEGAAADAAFQAKLKGATSGLGSFAYAPETYDAVVLAALAADLAHDDAGPAVASHLVAASTGGIKCGSYAECVDVLRTEPDIDYDGLSGTLDLDRSDAPAVASYGVYAYDGSNKYARSGTVRF